MKIDFKNVQRRVYDALNVLPGGTFVPVSMPTVGGVKIEVTEALYA